MGIDPQIADFVVRTVEERVRSIEVRREDFTSLRNTVMELAEAQKRTEQAIANLAQRMDDLAKQVGALSENIGFGLEDVARVVLPGYLLKHQGIQVEDFTREFFQANGREVEINLCAAGQKGRRQIRILGECKSRIYGREVEKFDEESAMVMSRWKEKVLRLMFGFYIHPSATQAARRKNILLVASYQR